MGAPTSRKSRFSGNSRNTTNSARNSASRQGLVAPLEWMHGLLLASLMGMNSKASLSRLSRMQTLSMNDDGQAASYSTSVAGSDSCAYQTMQPYSSNLLAPGPDWQAALINLNVCEHMHMGPTGGVTLNPAACLPTGIPARVSKTK